MILSPTSRRCSDRRHFFRTAPTIALVVASWLAASLTQAQEPNSLPIYPAVSRVVDAASGDVWIGTLGGGLLRESKGRIDVFDQMNSGLPGNLVYSLAIGGGRVFVATNGGTCSFDPFMEEWDLLDPRRSDRPQWTVVELRWTERGLFGRLWGIGVRRWDEPSRTWKPTDEPWPDRASRADGPMIQPDSFAATLRPRSIAILGPGTRRMALPGDEWPLRRPVFQPDFPAAQDAVARRNPSLATREEACFELADATPGYSRYGWGLLEDDLVSYADRQEVLGVVANLDDRSSYTEAATAFLKMPMVNISDGSAESTTAMDGERWVFRCRGTEPRRYRVLLDAVVGGEQCRRWTVVCDETHLDAQVRSSWTRSYAQAIGLPEVGLVSWNRQLLDVMVDAALRGAPQAIFVWTDAARTAEFVRALRAAGSTALVVTGPEAIAPEFIRGVGERAGRVMALPVSDDSPTRRINPTAPSSLSARTFAATDHLLSAMLVSGANRGTVREALSAMEENVFGERHAEPNHPSPRPVRIARLTEGHWEYEDVAEPAATSDP